MNEQERLDREELPAAYAELANTECGRIVLADLKRKFDHDEVFDPDPLIMAGRAKEQGVIRYIEKRVKKGNQL